MFAFGDKVPIGPSSSRGPTLLPLLWVGLIDSRGFLSLCNKHVHPCTHRILRPFQTRFRTTLLHLILSLLSLSLFIFLSLSLAYASRHHTITYVSHTPCAHLTSPYASETKLYLPIYDRSVWKGEKKSCFLAPSLGAHPRDILAVSTSTKEFTTSQIRENIFTFISPLNFIEMQSKNFNWNFFHTGDWCTLNWC